MVRYTTYLNVVGVVILAEQSYTYSQVSAREGLNGTGVEEIEALPKVSEPVAHANSQYIDISPHSLRGWRVGTSNANLLRMGVGKNRFPICMKMESTCAS